MQAQVGCSERDRPRPTIIACSVLFCPKSCCSREQQLNYGPCQRQRRTEPGRHGRRRTRRRRRRLRKDYISFVSALGRCGARRSDGRTDGPPKRRERERERERTKLSTPDKNVERKERRLASNTNTTYSYCRLEACWLLDGREEERRPKGREAWKVERGRQTDRPMTRTTHNAYDYDQVCKKADRLWGYEMSAIPANYRWMPIKSQRVSHVVCVCDKRALLCRRYAQIWRHANGPRVCLGMINVHMCTSFAINDRPSPSHVVE